MSTPLKRPGVGNLRRTKSKSLTPTKSGNLIGSPRILNDIVVSIHRVVQEWKQGLETGTKHIKTLQMFRHSDDQNENEDLAQKACEKIGDIVRQMEYVKMLKDYSENLYNLSILNEQSPSPFFSWKYSQFYEMAVNTYKVFEAETSLRAQLAIAFGTAKYENSDFCAIAWIHLVYAGSLFDIQFEAMLLEIGQSKYV